MIDIPASNIALVFMSVGDFFSDLDVHMFPKTLAVSHTRGKWWLLGRGPKSNKMSFLGVMVGMWGCIV